MKKGRPAHTVQRAGRPVAGRRAGRPCWSPRPARSACAADRSSGGPGPLDDEVDVDDQPVRVKVSPGRVKAEHDDAARVARALGLPLREVLAAAEATWRGPLLASIALPVAFGGAARVLNIGLARRSTRSAGVGGEIRRGGSSGRT